MFNRATHHPRPSCEHFAEFAWLNIFYFIFQRPDQSHLGCRGDFSPVYTWPTSSEPGLAPSQARCLVPLRACLHYRSRVPRRLDHQHGRPQFAPCSACALRFSKISTMSRSYGGQFAATTKMITLIYFILPYSRILGAIQQTNSRRGAWSFLRSCILGIK